MDPRSRDHDQLGPLSYVLRRRSAVLPDGTEVSTEGGGGGDAVTARSAVFAESASGLDSAFRHVAGQAEPPVVTIVVAASDATSSSKADADYVCDGTNDQTEINAAIAALPAVGGTVLLTEGNFYIVGSIVMNRHGVTLAGRSAGSAAGWSPEAVGTRLRWVSGTTPIVDVRRTDLSFPCANVTLRDFAVDGNGSGSAVHGIMFRAFSSIIDRVHVHRCGGDGIRVQGYSPADPNGRWATYDTHIVNCITKSNGLSGFHSAGYGEDLQVAIVTSASNGRDGFEIEGSSNQIIDCHGYSNGRYGLLMGASAARVKCLASKFEHSLQHGVYMQGAQGLLSGCNIHRSSAQTNATYNNVTVAGSDCLVTGNSIGYATGEAGNHPNRGLVAESGSSGLASGNHIFGSYPGGTHLVSSASFKLRGNNVTDVN